MCCYAPYSCVVHFVFPAVGFSGNLFLKFKPFKTYKTESLLPINTIAFVLILPGSVAKVRQILLYLKNAVL